MEYILLPGAVETLPVALPLLIRLERSVAASQEGSLYAWQPSSALATRGEALNQLLAALLAMGTLFCATLRAAAARQYRLYSDSRVGMVCWGVVCCRVVGVVDSSAPAYIKIVRGEVR